MINFQHPDDLPFIESSIDESGYLNCDMAIKKLPEWVNSKIENEDGRIELPNHDFLAVMTR